MAYMNQEKKQKLAANLKAALKGYNIKYTLAVRHHSTIVMNIKSSDIDFIGNYNEQNQDNTRDNHISVHGGWFENSFTGTALEVLNKIFKALNDGNHDRSDMMTDYFDVGWYVNVNIGQWNKAFELTK